MATSAEVTSANARRRANGPRRVGEHTGGDEGDAVTASRGDELVDIAGDGSETVLVDAGAELGHPAGDALGARPAVGRRELDDDAFVSTAARPAGASG